MNKLYKLFRSLSEIDNTFSEEMVLIRTIIENNHSELKESNLLMLIAIGWHFGHLFAISNKITDSNLPLNICKIFKEEDK